MIVAWIQYTYLLLGAATRSARVNLTLIELCWVNLCGKPGTHSELRQELCVNIIFILRLVFLRDTVNHANPVELRSSIVSQS